MIKLLILLIAVSFSHICLAGSSEFVVYTIEKDDSLDSIAYSFISKYYPQKLEDIKSYIEEVVYWNPHIYDWNKLTIGSNIYLGYPFPSAIEDRNHLLKNFSLSVTYGVSSGKLSEDVPATFTSVESSQNSVLSLGLQGRFNVLNWEKLVSTSIYYSQLQVTSVGGGGSYQPALLHFSPEIGGNLYYQFYLKRLSLHPYVGIDYENLITFNTKELTQGASLVTRKNSMFYGTLGLAHGFQRSFLVFFLRGSVSKSIISRTTSGNQGDRYEGYKGIVSLSFKESESPWLFNMFYKVHLLSGPTELVINRIGVGIGFNFF